METYGKWMFANYALDHLRIFNFCQIYHRPPGKQTNDKLEKSKIINELTYFPIENLGDDQASHVSFQGCTLLIKGRKYMGLPGVIIITCRRYPP